MQINLARRNTFNEATCVSLQSHLPQQPPYSLYEVHKHSISFPGKKKSDVYLSWSCTNTCIMMDNCVILCHSVVRFFECILSSAACIASLGARRRAATPSCQKEPAEVVQASY